MRRLLPISALLAAACSYESEPRPPPADRFIHPVSVVHRAVPGSSQGVLYVASANFDRCFDQGSVLAVDLGRVGADGAGLPPLGAPPSAGLAQLTELNLAEGAHVSIQSFAGDMALWNRQSAPPRLFVTSRSEGNLLHAIDLPEPLRLECVGASGRNCAEGALSLDDVPGAVDGQPRAPSPMGVAVSQQDGEVWVTHLDLADSPLGSLSNYQSYVLRLPGSTLQLDASGFYPLAPPGTDLPLGSSQGVAIGSRYVFVSGRFLSGVTGDATSARRFLVRLVDRTQPGRLLDPALELSYAALEGRGLALSPDETRLYVAARTPDTLLVVDLQNTRGETPRLSVVGAVPLPAGASQVAVIPRSGRSELVAITCSTAGTVVLYDPDVGQVVAQVGQVGTQPYGLAVDAPAGSSAARLFVTNFGDGRVAVIDIPELSRPQGARLVAHIGARQDGERVSGTCQEVSQ